MTIRGAAATLRADRPICVRKTSGGREIRPDSNRRLRLALPELASILTIAAGGALVAAAAAESQSPADGEEFVVNTTTTGWQTEPAVVVGPQGEFAVVWTSSESAGTDTSYHSIQLQRFSPNGTPVGPEVQVNNHTFLEQFDASTSIDGTGRMIVAWSSRSSPGPAIGGLSIQARRFAAEGEPLGGQFQVNTGTSGGQVGTTVSSDASGNFVVTWNSCYACGGGSLLPKTAGSYLSHRAHAQLYDSTATPVGEQFRIDDDPIANSFSEDVAWRPSGGFLVVWGGDGDSSGDSDTWNARGQRYAPDGTPEGAAFQVNSYTTGAQGDASIAYTSTDSFVVVWSSEGSDGDDQDETSIQLRRFDDAGLPLGDEFQVNEFTSGAQGSPDVAADGDGGFLVIWQSWGSFGSDDSGFSIQGRHFGANGEPLGGQFQLNTFTTGPQTLPSVATDASGNFLVAWQSEGSDGDRTGIRARFYLVIFNDGFETRGTARWSSTTP